MSLVRYHCLWMCARWDAQLVELGTGDRPPTDSLQPSPTPQRPPLFFFNSFTWSWFLHSFKPSAACKLGNKQEPAHNRHVPCFGPRNINKVCGFSLSTACLVKALADKLVFIEECQSLPCLLRQFYHLSILSHLLLAWGTGDSDEGQLTWDRQIIL